MQILLILSTLKPNEEGHSFCCEEGVYNLGYNLSDEVVAMISDQIQFDKMKESSAANMYWMKEYHEEGATPFLRKGIIGDWCNHFTDARMD